MSETPGALTVRQYVALILEGKATSEKLVSGCLARIDSSDGDIGAWVHLNRETAISQATSCDESRKRGLPTGSLQGIPVGIKDIFDTVDYPTERGTPIYAGRRPDADCAVVEKLREAGAVIPGKTVTSELAWMHPAETKNPHSVLHTPGGSSSGSAAAVAAGHVPLAIGSQTGGSTIRPASFCGIYGFKPSRGIISRRGVFKTSSSLDQVGLFGQYLGDVALLADALGGYDATDKTSYLAPRPRMLDGYLADVPIEPIFAWLDLPYADRFSPATVEGCEELMDALGSQVERIQAPQFFDEFIECHQIIYDYEIYQNLALERTSHWDQLSETAKSGLLDAGNRTQNEYDEAMTMMGSANQWFSQFFNDYDAIITPSATGEAPRLSDSTTGDPICCTVWTLCGLPCISMPLLAGEDGLPIGVQFVAGFNEDDRLLRTSRWLLNFLNSCQN